MTEYVTIDDALFFHSQLIAHFGGRLGIRDLGALESALHRPQTGYYDTLIHEAAALIEGIVQIHPFIDGNKRVAFAVMDVFLRINGRPIDAQSTVICKRITQFINARTFDMEHLVPWLEDISLPAEA